MVELKNQSRPPRMLSYAIPHDIIEPKKSTIKTMARDPATGDTKHKIIQISIGPSLHIPYGQTVAVEDRLLQVPAIVRDIEAGNLKKIAAEAPATARVMDTLPESRGRNAI